VSVASDGFVFVADCSNDRVQVLTPTLDFHGFIGQGQLSHPSGVCANADVVVVSDCSELGIAVFNRGDGTLRRRFGEYGFGDGQLGCPLGLCFIAGDRHVAIADNDSDRVSVFSVDGEFIRSIGEGVLCSPHGVAASAAFDELVVADSHNERCCVFDFDGELLHVVAAVAGDFTGVAMHGGSLFVQDYVGQRCVSFPA
jgi:DNA-binding beta-propeller fold protein YncE